MLTVSIDDQQKLACIILNKRTEKKKKKKWIWEPEKKLLRFKILVDSSKTCRQICELAANWVGGQSPLS